MTGLSLFTAATLLTFASPAASMMPVAQSPMCAIDMGSNTFRRITGRFADGRYEQQPIERKTLAVGDDVTRTGRISDTKLAEIGQTLSAFKAACEKDGAARVVAIGTAAFRDAANGQAAVDLAKGLGIDMEIATEVRESELAYLVGTLGRNGYAVIDNGSRSIELVARDDRAQIRSSSTWDIEWRTTLISPLLPIQRPRRGFSQPSDKGGRTGHFHERQARADRRGIR